MLTENLIVLKGKGVDISKIDFKDYLFDCDRDNLYKWMKYATDDSLCDADKVLKDNEVLVKLGWGGTKYIDCIFSLKSLFNRFRAYFTTGTPYRDFSLKEAFDNYDKIFCGEEKERFCKANEIDKKFIVDLFVEINRFAKNTNTIGNYMPCPDNEYNAIKGCAKKDKYFGYQHFQDRLEKLYYYLDHDFDKNNETKASYPLFKEKREQYKKWFDESIEKYHIAIIINNQNLLSIDWKLNDCLKIEMQQPQGLEKYYEYLKLANQLIEDRGKILAKYL